MDKHYTYPMPARLAGIGIFLASVLVYLLYSIIRDGVPTDANGRNVFLWGSLFVLGMPALSIFAHLVSARTNIKVGQGGLLFTSPLKRRYVSWHEIEYVEKDNADPAGRHRMMTFLFLPSSRYIRIRTRGGTRLNVYDALIYKREGSKGFADFEKQLLGNLQAGDMRLVDNFEALEVSSPGNVKTIDPAQKHLKYMGLRLGALLLILAGLAYIVSDAPEGAGFVERLTHDRYMFKALLGLGGVSLVLILLKDLGKRKT